LLAGSDSAVIVILVAVIHVVCFVLYMRTSCPLNGTKFMCGKLRGRRTVSEKMKDKKKPWMVDTNSAGFRRQERLGGTA